MQLLSGQSVIEKKQWMTLRGEEMYVRRSAFHGEMSAYRMAEQRKKILRIKMYYCVKAEPLLRFCLYLKKCVS